ncbi:hypothetical protein JYB64_12795 [Algoriphagus aestuarii]|nr:hypothetical protein [Algoriphagus aestuarii]
MIQIVRLCDHQQSCPCHSFLIHVAGRAINRDRSGKKSSVWHILGFIHLITGGIADIPKYFHVWLCDFHSILSAGLLFLIHTSIDFLELGEEIVEKVPL